MENYLVTCAVCGAEKKDLRNHLRIHGITSEDYKKQFPGSRVTSERTARLLSDGISAGQKRRPAVTDTTRAIISAKSKEYHAKNAANPTYIERQSRTAALARAAKGENYRHSEETKQKMRGPRPSARREKSQSHKEALSRARKGKSNGPHSEETKQRMREAWMRRKANKDAYAAYTASLSERMSSPKMVEDIRRRVANRMKANEQGKTNTKIELLMKSYLDSENLAYEHQHIIVTRKGSFVFDFFIPSLNLLVETDGEYWHSKSMQQINRDKLKDRLAREIGYGTLRISDKDWRPELIHAEPDEWHSHSRALLAQREAKFPK